MNRAHSLLTIKSIDEDQRIITGIASTPSPDRMDDIVMPRGAVMKLPLPLLWQHDSSQPVGTVTAAKVGDDGITVTCQFAQVDAPASLKDDLDRAWAMVKARIVRGFSIGFNPLESADIEGSWGRRFTKWEMLELSCVTIPANADCTIQTIKSVDLEQLAASGRGPHDDPPRREPPPGVSGTTTTNGPKRAVFLSRKDSTMKKTIAQQIQDLENTRAAKAARMNEVMSATVDEGRSSDTAEAEEFDALETEIKSIDGDLQRLRRLEKMNASTATPVDGSSSAAASASRAGTPNLKTVEKLQPGQAFGRFVQCLVLGKGDIGLASRIAQRGYQNDERLNNVLKTAADIGSTGEQFMQRLMQTKASVAAGTTTDATWAAPLLSYDTLTSDFIEFLRGETVIGKFGTGNIPALKAVPFNVHIKGQSVGGSAGWVGQGAPKPVTAFGYFDQYIGFTKVAAITVITEELARFSNPKADLLVRDSLRDVIVERIDTDFLDPDKAAVANVSPAAITNGVTPITSSGNTADDVRDDIARLWGAAIAAKLPMRGAVYITDPTTALRLSLMRNPLGQAEFPDITMLGGTFMGVPVIVSDYALNNSSGNMFVLAFASEIYLADDGQVTVDASREASIQMLDNPTNHSGTATPTTMVSMFQTNSIAMRAERYINWAKRRVQAVAYIADQNWGA